MKILTVRAVLHVWWYLTCRFTVWLRLRLICKQSDAKDYHGSHVSNMCKSSFQAGCIRKPGIRRKIRMIYLSAISVYNNVILNSESETSMARKKRAAKEDLGSLDEETSPSTKKSKKLDSRFGGMTEEEVAKLLLPDHMRPGLDIIFVSLWGYSSQQGHLPMDETWQGLR